MTRLKTMMIVAGLTLTAAPVANATTESVVAGGCGVQASAKLSGLTLSSSAFSYHYTGKLTGCVYTRKGGPKSGTITAGEPIRIKGQLYQEPLPSGTGTCLKTQTSGYDFAHWADGTQTIVQFETTGGSGGTHLVGEVIPQITLHALNSSKTTTFKTNRFLDQHVVGRLNFKVANPLDCTKPAGLKRANITGVLGHVGLVAGA
jgi:hypothetical protein